MTMTTTKYHNIYNNNNHNNNINNYYFYLCYNNNIRNKKNNNRNYYYYYYYYNKNKDLDSLTYYIVRHWVILITSRYTTSYLLNICKTAEAKQCWWFSGWKDDETFEAERPFGRGASRQRVNMKRRW